MHKRALEIDPEVVKRYAIGGAIGGGSAAALLNLIRMVRQMNDDRKAAKEPTDTDENTIFLTLPRKAAAVQGEKKEPTKIKKVEVTKVALTRGPGSQCRRCDGTIGIKTASGWPTLTAAVLAAMGSAAVGGTVVNRIYDYKREQQLQGQLSEAQQEYMDLLQGGGKVAEALDELFAYPGMDKDAQQGGKTFGTVSYPLAFVALLSILGTGGAGYITKKVLDEKLRQTKEKKLEIPKVKRIVFRSQPQLEEENEESKVAEEEVGAIRASLGVMMDKLGHRTLILDTPYVKEAMAKSDTSTIKLFKMAQDIDELRAYLEANPQLRRLIQRATMEKHPIMRNFKWGLKLPFMGGRADKKLMSRFEDAFKLDIDPVERLPNTSPLPPEMQGKHFFGLRGKAKAREQLAGGPAAKLAQFSAGSVLASTLGSTLAEQDNSKAEERLADALVNAQQRAKQEEADKLSPAEVAGGVSLEASDPAAKEYLVQNREKVLAILQQMAEAKQLAA